jgi:hypothetical protein
LDRLILEIHEKFCGLIMSHILVINVAESDVQYPHKHAHNLKLLSSLLQRLFHNFTKENLCTKLVGYKNHVVSLDSFFANKIPTRERQQIHLNVKQNRSQLLN